jgi:hypothetical protein
METACEYCGSKVCLKWSDEKCRHTGQIRTSYEAKVAEAAKASALKPLSRQNKAELIATATAFGLEVPDGATVPEIRAALTPAGFSTPEGPPSDEDADEEEAESDEDTETSPVEPTT